MDFEETGRLVAAGPALLEVRPGSERGIVGQRVTASTNGIARTLRFPPTRVSGARKPLCVIFCCSK
ncbi:MAG: hypothetical protein ACRD6B_02815 [Bryobacteraceae bacterium]